MPNHPDGPGLAVRSPLPIDDSRYAAEILAAGDDYEDRLENI
jgi:hypothetical protein